MAVPLRHATRFCGLFLIGVLVQVAVYEMLVYTVGSAINPTVVDYVIITADGAAPSTSTTAAGGRNDTVQAVPFEHAWLLGLLVLGYCTYAILRTRR